MCDELRTSLHQVSGIVADSFVDMASVVVPAEGHRLKLFWLWALLRNMAAVWLVDLMVNSALGFLCRDMVWGWWGEVVATGGHSACAWMDIYVAVATAATPRVLVRRTLIVPKPAAR